MDARGVSDPGEYRDPLPSDPTMEDHPFLQFFPPDRQQYWRQVQEWDGRIYRRWANTTATVIQAELIGHLINRVAGAIEKLEAKIDASRAQEWHP
jgi:hypothetical protein